MTVCRITRRAVSLAIAMAWGSGLVGLGTSSVLANTQLWLPSRSVRGDRPRKGWSSASVTVGVTVAKDAIRTVDKARHEIMDAVEELVASQGPGFADWGRQRAVREQIADLVLRVAPPNSILAVNTVSLTVNQ